MADVNRIKTILIKSQHANGMESYGSLHIAIVWLHQVICTFWLGVYNNCEAERERKTGCCKDGPTLLVSCSSAAPLGCAVSPAARCETAAGYSWVQLCSSPAWALHTPPQLTAASGTGLQPSLLRNWGMKHSSCAKTNGIWLYTGLEPSHKSNPSCDSLQTWTCIH